MTASRANRVTAGNPRETDGFGDRCHLDCWISRRPSYTVRRVVKARNAGQPERYESTSYEFPIVSGLVRVVRRRGPRSRRAAPDVLSVDERLGSSLRRLPVGLTA